MPEATPGMATDTGAEGAPQDTGTSVNTSQQAGGAATGAPAADRPDFLLEGYNSAEEQARAYHQQHSSIKEMQQIADWYQQNYDDLQKWHQSRQQPQQPQQPQMPKSLGWLEQSKDPQFMAAFQVAQMHGGQLPEGYQNREQVMQQMAQVQQFWDNAYANPEQMMLDLFQLPQIQQAIQQMAGKTVQPIQQQVQEQHVNNLLQTYGPHLQKMHPMAQELFNEGRWGGGEAAAKAALAYNQKLVAELNKGKQPPPTNGQPPANEPGKASQPQASNANHVTNGKPNVAASNGVRDRRAASEDAIKKHSLEAARAKIAHMKERSG